LGDNDTDVRIILKWIWRSWNKVFGLDSSDSGESWVGSCEYDRLDFHKEQSFNNLATIIFSRRPSLHVISQCSIARIIEYNFWTKIKEISDAKEWDRHWLWYEIKIIISFYMQPFFFFFIWRLTSSFESFGLLSDVFPFYSVFNTGYPNFNVHLTNVLT
jgi:hypothetical protein